MNNDVERVRHLLGILRVGWAAHRRNMRVIEDLEYLLGFSDTPAADRGKNTKRITRYSANMTRAERFDWIRKQIAKG